MRWGAAGWAMYSLAIRWGAPGHLELDRLLGDGRCGVRPELLKLHLAYGLNELHDPERNLHAQPHVAGVLTFGAEVLGLESTGCYGDTVRPE